MESLEDKFRALEIDDELEKLKEKLRSAKSGQGSNNEKISRFYKILGVKADASPKEVKEAYRNFVKKWHPDLFYENPQRQQKAEEVVKKINQLYDELCYNKGY